MQIQSQPPISQGPINARKAQAQVSQPIENKMSAQRSAELHDHVKSMSSHGSAHTCCEIPGIWNPPVPKPMPPNVIDPDAFSIITAEPDRVKAKSLVKSIVYKSGDTATMARNLMAFSELVDNMSRHDLKDVASAIGRLMATTDGHDEILGVLLDHVLDAMDRAPSYNQIPLPNWPVEPTPMPQPIPYPTPWGGSPGWPGGGIGGGDFIELHQAQSSQNHRAELMEKAVQALKKSGH